VRSLFILAAPRWCSCSWGRSFAIGPTAEIEVARLHDDFRIRELSYI
jgi:hypothetical protein